MDDALEVIANPATRRRALIDAIAALGGAGEPARFWAAIANDERYLPEHRRRAVFALFARHVKPGTTLAELALMLDGAAWLDDRAVIHVSSLTGKLPVRWTATDTVFALPVLPGVPAPDSELWSVYLRLKGAVTRERFLSAIKGEDGVAGAVEIREVGFSPAPSLKQRP